MLHYAVTSIVSQLKKIHYHDINFVAQLISEITTRLHLICESTRNFRSAPNQEKGYQVHRYTLSIYLALS